MQSAGNKVGVDHLWESTQIAVLLETLALAPMCVGVAPTCETGKNRKMIGQASHPKSHGDGITVPVCA